jgi:hypothetical protein
MGVRLKSLLNLKTRRLVLLVSACFLASVFPAFLLYADSPGTDDLVQVEQDFRADPGWENMNNRVVADDGPVIKQDFGWRPTSHAGGALGEIGGTVWRSRTPSWYGLKLKPLSLDDPLSAAGRLVLTRGADHGGVYFGFFNSTRQGWRPWSSVAVRVGELRNRTTRATDVHIDYMTGTWRAGGFQTAAIAADDRPHSWRLKYDPAAIVPSDWPDARLQTAIGAGRRTEAEVLAEARRAEPGLTPEQLRPRLLAAEDLGLIEFHTRRGTGWEARRQPDKVKGKITFQLDDGPPRPYFLSAEHRAEPAVFDRFGIFNFQLPGQSTELYLSDLEINGRKIDLSKDPGWQGHGNQVTFRERDFHPGHDFGYRASNHAGKAAGEVGGTLWRTEAVDPYHAYYADEVGALTLDDPISFSGAVAFTDGATDAGAFFGYFNKKERLGIFKNAEDGAPLPQTMGIVIDGPTRVGYYFSGQLTPADKKRVANIQGPIFVPDGRKHRFAFTYDPTANKGLGRVSLTLDGAMFHHDLRPEQRAAGATLDRFGLMNVRRGGKFVTLFFDDLVYTARRPGGKQPARHNQSVTKVPYPDGGRMYR